MTKSELDQIAQSLLSQYSINIIAQQAIDAAARHGLTLTRTEIKSIRAGKASLVDTYCYINNGEIWVKNMYVALYSEGSYNNHVERRERKLLLNRKEIRNLQEDTKAPGFTIVPVRLFINEKGLAKLDIALARGKKEYDKRQTLKEKEDRREIDRAKKNFIS